jgi:hypothetical protein
MDGRQEIQTILQVLIILLFLGQFSKILMEKEEFTNVYIFKKNHFPTNNIERKPFRLIKSLMENLLRKFKI